MIISHNTTWIDYKRESGLDLCIIIMYDGASFHISLTASVQGKTQD